MTSGEGRQPNGAGRAIVIHPDLRTGEPGARSPESCLDEAIGLALAIELEVVHAETVRVNRPQPATLLGSGSVESIAAAVEQQGAATADIARSIRQAWEAIARGIPLERQALDHPELAAAIAAFGPLPATEPVSADGAI